MITEIAIIGIGGQGRECLDIAEAMRASGEDLRVIGFYDDAPSEPNLARLAQRGYKWLGETADALKRNYAVCLGIGDGRVRAALDAELMRCEIVSPVLIHPHSTVGHRVELAPGAVIFAGARLTTNIRIGRHVHVNQNATVGHDCTIQDYVTINPLAAVSGSVQIGTAAMIGAGAVVLQGLRIGARARVGACACVTEDVQEGITVKGVPAA